MQYDLPDFTTTRASCRRNRRELSLASPLAEEHSAFIDLERLQNFPDLTTYNMGTPSASQVLYVPSELWRTVRAACHPRTKIVIDDPTVVAIARADGDNFTFCAQAGHGTSYNRVTHLAAPMVHRIVWTLLFPDLLDLDRNALVDHRFFGIGDRLVVFFLRVGQDQFVSNNFLLDPIETPLNPSLLHPPQSRHSLHTSTITYRTVHGLQTKIIKVRNQRFATDVCRMPFHFNDYTIHENGVSMTITSGPSAFSNDPMRFCSQPAFTLATSALHFNQVTALLEQAKSVPVFIVVDSERIGRTDTMLEQAAEFKAITREFRQSTIKIPLDDLNHRGQCRTYNFVDLMATRKLLKEVSTAMAKSIGRIANKITHVKGKPLEQLVSDYEIDAVRTQCVSMGEQRGIQRADAYALFNQLLEQEYRLKAASNTVVATTLTQNMEVKHVTRALNNPKAIERDGVKSTLDSAKRSTESSVPQPLSDLIYLWGPHCRIAHGISGWNRNRSSQVVSSTADDLEARTLPEPQSAFAVSTVMPSIFGKRNRD